MAPGQRVHQARHHLPQRLPLTRRPIRRFGVEEGACHHRHRRADGAGSVVEKHRTGVGAAAASPMAPRRPCQPKTVCVPFMVTDGDSYRMRQARARRSHPEQDLINPRGGDFYLASSGDKLDRRQGSTEVTAASGMPSRIKTGIARLSRTPAVPDGPAAMTSAKFPVGRCGRGLRLPPACRRSRQGSDQYRRTSTWGGPDRRPGYRPGTTRVRCARQKRDPQAMTSEALNSGSPPRLGDRPDGADLGLRDQRGRPMEHRCQRPGRCPSLSSRGTTSPVAGPGGAQRRRPPATARKEPE
jgi:hypothetical protein